MNQESNYAALRPANQVFRIDINPENVHLVLKFMISNNLPFSMTSDTISEDKAKIATDKTKIIQISKYTKNRTITLDVLEAIYQKHIVDSLESIPPKLAIISSNFGVNEHTLKIVFKSYFKKSFYQIYMDKKMEHSAKLLRNGLNANSVSEKIGYSAPIKFNKMFQKHFGITPKKYQQTHFDKLFRE